MPLSDAEVLRGPAGERRLRASPAGVPERNLTPPSALATPRLNPERFIDGDEDGSAIDLTVQNSTRASPTD
jgi:hypothetical protein